MSQFLIAINKFQLSLASHSAISSYLTVAFNLRRTFAKGHCLCPMVAQIPGHKKVAQGSCGYHSRLHKVHGSSPTLGCTGAPVWPNTYEVGGCFGTLSLKCDRVICSEKLG
ncbi:hypothetical protein CDAR_74921 [Caerostris darwini]|uniref:Uncharacterized protein n=1 Tax=Caerostris darwini TaxID=1538125 RepID=A0AAV4P1V6_9ARAC|nr:hypothetical protein CDAR_74921 [Caerostris darwini]